MLHSYSANYYLAMKIIIAGAGEVGSYVAKMLCNNNHDIIIIDNMYEERLKWLDANYDLLTIFDYPCSIKVLKDAHIKTADLFIAVTPYETMNITAAVLAKRLGAAKTTARIDNNEYLSPKNLAFFNEIGIDSLIYPELLAAKEIANLLKQAGTNKIFDFAGGKLSLFVIKLEDPAPVIGHTLAELADENDTFDYRVVAITRNSKTIIPNGSDRLNPKDIVYVITNQEGAKEVLKHSGIENYEVKNAMILGGSRIGKKTAKAIEGDIDIKLLEVDKKKSFDLANHLDNTLVLNADGRDINLLIDEGLKTMDAFIAVTGDSETNLLSCIVAKRMGVHKTIAEIENMDYLGFAGNMGIDSIINKKLIAASHIFRYTINADVASVQCLTGTDAEVLEFIVHEKTKITKAPLQKLNFPKDAIIGGVVRGESNIIAKGDCVIEPGDQVVVFALPSAIDHVAKFFK